MIALAEASAIDECQGKFKWLKSNRYFSHHAIHLPESFFQFFFLVSVVKLISSSVNFFPMH